MIGLLVFSATVISSSLYFLWRVLQFPDISHVDALLIGVAIASAFFLCAWGTVSGRGNVVESSLLLAYIVLCIYQIFTDFQPSHPTRVTDSHQQASPDFPPFPPIIMASYTTLMQLIHNLPGAILSAFNFLTAAFATVTPSVLVSLAYRLFVLYAAFRIVPAVNESGARGLSKAPSLEDTNGANQFLAFISWFSPTILIAVYTSLLMQHFATTMGPESETTGALASWWYGSSQPSVVDGNLWKWINLAGTMGLYAVELWLGNEDDIDGGHWKVD
ncbi:putative ice2 family protein [Phaeomoniella chlamydospora]|uniref:Putative ice2 family protein n=1 Tax=Phaeomoniella chlamydospora TaxID=158046 RepID=A0A0G2ETM2_PHACM|nr:putative ice2 family protein [Phaeomoniella chlamydospora]